MAKKRGNGEGCIRKLKDGYWEARIMRGWKDDGRPYIKTFTAKTRGELSKKLNDFIVNCKNKEPETACNQTMVEWMWNWFNDYVDKNVKTSTKSSYETIIKRHLIPYIGYIKLKDLRKADIEDMYNKLLKNGRADKKGGLSVKTVRNIALVLHKALDEAMKHEYIFRNVADIANVPTLRSTNTEKEEIEVLTKQEQKMLIEACGNDTYGVAVQTVLFTGIRLGELLGLQWKDFDNERGTIKIERQVNRLKDYSPNAKAKTRLGIQNDTKTKTSKRVISLPENLTKLLMEYKEQQDINKQRWGKDYKDNGMMFAREDGNYLDPSTFRDHYNKILKEAELGHHTIHALRHPYVKPTTKKISLKSRNPRLSYFASLGSLFSCIFLCRWLWLENNSHYLAFSILVLV